MDGLSLIRMIGSLGLVLGVLAAGLWLVRRFNLRVPGAGARGGRLELVERTALDSRRSAVLIRRDGREHLLLVGPEGTVVVETSIICDGRDADAAEARRVEIEAQQAAVAEAIRQAQERVAASAERIWSILLLAGGQVRSAFRRAQVRQRIRRLALAAQVRVTPSRSFAAALARQCAARLQERNAAFERVTNVNVADTIQRHTTRAITWGGNCERGHRIPRAEGALRTCGKPDGEVGDRGDAAPPPVFPAHGAGTNSSAAVSLRTDEVSCLNRAASLAGKGRCGEAKAREQRSRSSKGGGPKPRRQRPTKHSAAR